MRINIRFTDTERDEQLRGYVEEKVSSFAKLMADREFDAAVCNIELKHSTHHHTGDVCYAEVTLEVEGKVHRSSKEEPTFEKAIDKVKDDILQSLREAKERTEHKFIKGAQKGKEMLRA